jgi:CheY-like chemotaxis protein
MRKKILIVDDQSDIILSVKLGLQDIDQTFEVMGVTSGKECFELLNKGYLPDLILLDVVMPITNGWEVQRRLKEHPTWRNIPILFLTVVSDKTSKKFGGIIAEDYIEKPFEIGDLKKRIDAALSKLEENEPVSHEANKQKKLLVVDDDPYILITMKELFEPEGFTVHTASSGQECLDELAKGFKGVILMDIMMPEMNGWETIRQIVANGYNTGNIISMFTAKDQIDQKVDDLKEFVFDYITKPFNPDDLIKTVNIYYSYLS